jgi:hypothetical protein
MAATLANFKDELGEALIGPVDAIFSQFDQAIGESLDDEADAQDIRATTEQAVATLRDELVRLLDEGNTSAPSDSSAVGETGDASVGALTNAGVSDDTTSDPIASPPLVLRLLDEIDQLTASFEATASSAIQLSSLEGIAAPSGNGKAFEKFIEQYHEKFGSTVDQNAELPLIDEHA